MRAFLVCTLLVFVVSTSSSQSVGIGTTTPNGSAALHVNSTTRGFLPPRMNSTQRNAIVSPLNGLMVYDTDAERLYVYQDGNWQFLINNAYWARSNSRNWIYNGGDSVGIGTAAPSAKLHVNGDVKISSAELLLSNSDVVMNRIDGIFQFQAAATNLAYVQLSGENLRLGTNTGNATGNLIIRMNGTDRVFVDEFGRMGIGTSTLSSRLHVNGHINGTSNLILGGDIVLTDNSEVTRPATGTKSLLPLCYGRVRFMATTASMTANVSVARLSEGVYELTCADFSSNTTIVVTMNEYQGGFHAWPNVENWPAGSNKYRIHFHNSVSGNLQDAGFSFVAYE